MQEKNNSPHYTLICNEKTLLRKKKPSSEVNLEAVPRTAVMDVSWGVKYYCNMRFFSQFAYSCFHIQKFLLSVVEIPVTVHMMFIKT